MQKFLKEMPNEISMTTSRYLPYFCSLTRAMSINNYCRIPEKPFDFDAALRQLLLRIQIGHD